MWLFWALCSQPGRRTLINVPIPHCFGTMGNKTKYWWLKKHQKTWILRFWNVWKGKNDNESSKRTYTMWMTTFYVIWINLRWRWPNIPRNTKNIAKCRLNDSTLSIALSAALTASSHGSRQSFAFSSLSDVAMTDCIDPIATFQKQGPSVKQEATI